MKAWRASILRFDNTREPARSAVFDEDGLLVTQRNAEGVETVVAVGPYQSTHQDALRHFPELRQTAVRHLPGRIIAPGFIDLHLHYPQLDVIGSPADGLLPWLENYTFPEEKRFSGQEYSEQAASFFIAELARNGVTTALTFATSHVESVNAFFAAAQAARMRLVTGLCLMDRNAPGGVLNQTEQSLIDTEALIQKWHAKARLGYAITPRFAPSCTDAQLQGAGQLAAKYPDVWIQSHVAENLDEIDWARALFPKSRSYLSTYDDFGLMRQRAVYAHCIHLDDADRALMAASGAAAAVCPTSNLFLGSGFFDFAAADQAAFRYGLASDVGGGTSFSPFRTMLAAYKVGRTGLQATLDGRAARLGLSLSPQQLWWQHTAGAARAMGLGGVVGDLQAGSEADFVVLNPGATPLLARRTARANSLDELLFAMIVLGDDRLVEQVELAGS